MENTEIIRKHITIHKTDLRYLNEIIRTHEKIKTISQAIAYLITNSSNYDELKKQLLDVQKKLTDEQKENIRLKAQSKQLSRIENEIGVLLDLQGVGTRSFPEQKLEDYRLGFDQLVDKQIKNAQEKIATNSVKIRTRKSGEYDDLFE